MSTLLGDHLLYPNNFYPPLHNWLRTFQKPISNESKVEKGRKKSNSTLSVNSLFSSLHNFWPWIREWERMAGEDDREDWRGKIKFPIYTTPPRIRRFCFCYYPYIIEVRHFLDYKIYSWIEATCAHMWGCEGMYPQQTKQHRVLPNSHAS